MNVTAGGVHRVPEVVDEAPAFSLSIRKTVSISNTPARHSDNMDQDHREYSDDDEEAKEMAYTAHEEEHANSKLKLGPAFSRALSNEASGDDEETFGSRKRGYLRSQAGSKAKKLPTAGKSPVNNQDLAQAFAEQRDLLSSQGRRGLQSIVGSNQRSYLAKRPVQNANIVNIKDKFQKGKRMPNSSSKSNKLGSRDKTGGEEHAPKPLTPTTQLMDASEIQDGPSPASPPAVLEEPPHRSSINTRNQPLRQNNMLNVVIQTNKGDQQDSLDSKKRESQNKKDSVSARASARQAANGSKESSKASVTVSITNITAPHHGSRGQSDSIDRDPKR